MSTLSKATVRKRLVSALIEAQASPLEIAARHRVAPEELSAWVAEPANQRMLNGLCVLADLQAQLLLSRYRLDAALRLIQLATAELPEGGEASERQKAAEAARKACLDLLKLDLKRTGAAAARELWGADDDAEADDLGAVERSGAALRRLLEHGEEAGGGAKDE